MSPSFHPRQRHYHVYVDESSQSGQRYMVLGALILESETALCHEAKLQHVRERNLRIDQEIKWGKASKSRTVDYLEFLQTTIGALHMDSPAYYAIVIDTSDLDHRRYNGGDREIGFSKFVYQLLMKCARLYCASGATIDCFLDQRVTRQTLTELRTILNNGAAKKFGSRPFKRVEYRDSKDSNLIQTVDLFTGAIAYNWNGAHLIEGASQARVEIAEWIAAQMRFKSLNVQTVGGRCRFSIWKFAASPRAR